MKMGIPMRGIVCAIAAMLACGTAEAQSWRQDRVRQAIRDQRSEMIRQYRQDVLLDKIARNRSDESRAERFTLIVSSTVGGRDYETSFEGPRGFIEAVGPCTTEDFSPVAREMVNMPYGDVDEIRFRTTGDKIAAFASCVERNTALRGS